MNDLMYCVLGLACAWRSEQVARRSPLGTSSSILHVKKKGKELPKKKFHHIILPEIVGTFIFTCKKQTNHNNNGTDEYLRKITQPTVKTVKKL